MENVGCYTELHGKNTEIHRGFMMQNIKYILHFCQSKNTFVFQKEF